MAEKLEDFSWNNSRMDSTFPYTKWLDGNIWRIRRGVDFDMPAKNMRVNLYSAADRRGVRVRTKLKGDEITLQAYPWDDPE